MMQQVKGFVQDQENYAKQKKQNWPSISYGKDKDGSAISIIL